MTLDRHRLRGTLALVAMAGVLACGGSDSTSPFSAIRTALNKAEAQWNAAAIHDYDYDLVSDRFGQHDSVQVQVRNDQVTLSKSYLSGQTTPVGSTVPDLFTAVDDAITAGLSIDVTFDPQVGYPSAGAINATTPGGGAAWKVVNFTQVP